MGHLHFAPNQPKDIPPPPSTKPVTVPKDPRERLRELLEVSGFLAERPSAPGVHTPAEGPTIQPNDGRSPWMEVFYGPGNCVPRNTDTYAYFWIEFMKPENRNEQRKWWPEPPPSNEVILEKDARRMLSGLQKGPLAAP